MRSFFEQSACNDFGPKTAAIFDFDGTIADSMREMLAAYNSVAPSLDLETISEAGRLRIHVGSNRYLTPEVRELRIGAQIFLGLPGQGDKVALATGSHCDVVTDAMPPSFYFASRGVVLPAGQNGGLPVATVNMPEVDVQFLRVAPERVPELFESVLGIGRSTASSDEEESGGYDEDDDDDY